MFKLLEKLFAALSVSSNTSAGLNTHSTAGESIRYYHVISVGVICFLIGAITSFVMLIHCQRISPALHFDHKPVAAADDVGMATADKRRDVMVTSQGGGATLQTVIRTASINEKLRMTSNSNSNNDNDNDNDNDSNSNSNSNNDNDNDSVNDNDSDSNSNSNSNNSSDGDHVFSRARASLTNGGGGGQTALVHLRQYYRRHYITTSY